MTLRPFQQAYAVVISMMADALLLPPAVEPYRLAACVDRWREQRIAEICIKEFGDEARAEVRARLQKNAEGAQRVEPGAHADDRRSNGGSRSFGSPLAGGAGLKGTVLAPKASMTDCRDGGRVSGETISGEAA